MKWRNFLYSVTSIVLTSFLVSVFIVFAADPGAPFAPDDNVQDPGDTGTVWGGCGPSDPNCYVTVSAGSAAFGTDNQIPFTNLAGNDFDYSANLTFDGTILSIPTLTLTGTGTLNGLDVIDATTETTLEAALDLAGDASGTLSALVVTDDSHAHTTTTVSGLDISDDTNLTAGTNITLTGDDLSVDDSFILNTGDTGTGTFNFDGDLNIGVSDGNTVNIDGDGTPTTDLLQIGSGDVSATSGVDALQITFDSADASGDAIDIVLSSITGNGSDTTNAIDVNAFTYTSSAGTDVVNGLNIGNLTESGTITSTAINIGTGWDTGITSAGSYVQSAGTMSLTSANTTQQTTSSIFALNGNSLTSGTGFYAESSTLSFGSLMNLVVTGTAALGDLQKVLNVSTSGANTNAGQTTYGGYFSNTHTGTTSDNIGVYSTASGGTIFNTAVRAVASGGTTATGLYATASGATNNYAVQSDGPLLVGGTGGNGIIIQYLAGPTLSLGAGATQVGSSNSLFAGQSAGGGATNASNSNFIGNGAGGNATNASDSNFLGAFAGGGATNADDSNFFGASAGYEVTAVDDANFFGFEAGYQATSASDSNFMGYRAGKLATNASSSNFFGNQAGTNATNSADSIFIGTLAGNGATDASYSVFLGNGTGQNAHNASGSVFIGLSAGYGVLNSNASNSIFLGFTAGGDAPEAANSIFIGENSGELDDVDNTTGGYSILLGPDTHTGDFSNSIAMGRGATNTASNQLIFGSDDANSYIDNVFFGTGATAASPVGVIINGSGGLGSDIAGASLTLAGGRATGNATGGSIIFQTSDVGGPGGTLQSLTTKATILPSGFFGINDTTPDYRLDIETDVASSVANFFNDGNNTNRAGIIIQAGVDDHTAVSTSTLATFLDGDGGTVGSITFGNSLTAYNTTSDRRLKENIEDTSLSIDNLMDIQIRDYTWKADKDHKLSHGFIAQELYDVYPSAVTIPNDTYGYYMVDYSKLMPLAIKSIQDLNINLKDIEDFADEDNSFGEKLKGWFGNIGNGIGDFFANRIRTKELCISDSEGETCITKDQLDALLLNSDIPNTEDDNNDEIGEVIIITGDEEEVIPNDLLVETGENLEEPIVEEPVIEEIAEEPIVEEEITP